MKILKFYADWCGPCKQLSKNIEKFEALHPEIDKIIPINVDDNDELIDKYNIRNVPVLIKVDDNDIEIDKKAGLLTVTDLEKWIC